uniref:Probable proton-coupled zinc antiporter SLC30A3 n=1 Tax=Denticeps clupeoides TaxID=299321 RepID=A0AAY4BRN3_9TELE
MLAKKKLYIASLVCLLFMIGEVIGESSGTDRYLAFRRTAGTGFMKGGSLYHCCLFFVIVEILGALVSVLSIWIVTGVLVYLAIDRIVKNDYEIEGHVMVLTSGCAVVVNIIMAYILHHSTTFHAHGHGHSHGLLGSHGNTSVRAAFIHVLGDLLQSVGVMVAAIIIYFRPEYKVADPICTFLFSVFVLGTTITILRDVFRILMEGNPR